MSNMEDKVYFFSKYGGDPIATIESIGVDKPKPRDTKNRPDFIIVDDFETEETRTRKGALGEYIAGLPKSTYAIVPKGMKIKYLKGSKSKKPR